MSSHTRSRSDPGRRTASPTTCPGCGSGNLVERKCTEGPHHAKLICGACTRFVRWIPRPPEPAGPPPPELLALAERVAGRRVTFRGSSTAQRSFASSVRANMLREAAERRDRDRELVLRAVADPSWFAGHATRPYEEVRWPRPDQLANPEGSDASTPR